MADTFNEQEMATQNESYPYATNVPHNTATSSGTDRQVFTLNFAGGDDTRDGIPSTVEYRSAFGGNGTPLSTTTTIIDRSYQRFSYGTISFREITGLSFIYNLWKLFERVFFTWMGPLLGRLLNYLSILCVALARTINHDQGEWGIVIREPLHAPYRLTLVGLPAEILDVVVASCEPVRQNGIRMFGADYLIEDRLHRDGTSRITSGPNMWGLAQTNRQLRCFQMTHMFKDKTLVLRHEDVSITVDFLAKLYPSAREGIKGLYIEWQRTKPADLKSFRRLCGIMNGMPKLSTLHLTIPINGSNAFRAILAPGLWNALVWHKDKMLWDTKKASEVLRSFGWSTSRQAGWIRDLLGVRGSRKAGEDGVQGFRFVTYPRAEGLSLKMWLESKMALEWEYKVAEVERINRRGSWVDWISA